MNSRLLELGESIRSLGECLCPWLRKFKVSYFRYFPHPSQPNMTTREWTEVEIMAYNREDAVKRVNEQNKIDPPLRHSRNCFVSRVIGSPSK